MKGRINMLETIKDLGAKLNSYSEESTTEDRTRVIDKTNGDEGIVIENEGEKIVVKWLKTGSIKEYTKKSLENINSDVCYAERLMTQIMNAPGIVSMVVPTTSTKPVPNGGNPKPHTSAVVTFSVNK
jgi:hypothetical protein